MTDETILIVEDNPLNCKLFRTILELDGFSVVDAVNAEDGLVLAREHLPNIILMDIQLPEMDGLQATRIIKKDPHLKDIPVIALTAHAMEGDDSKAYDAGCSGYITKPVKVQTFVESIRSFLCKGSEQDDSEKTPLLPVIQPPEASRYKKTILIVDDELLNLKMFEGMLTGQPYNVITATGGLEALAAVKTHAPDLILLDIMMPDLNGYEVTRRLKSNSESKEIPIILITALRDYDCKIKGLEAGADEFLNKPVQTEELLTRVQSLLRMKEYQDRLANKLTIERSFTSKVDVDEDAAHQGVVLLIEDNPGDRLLIASQLTGEPYRLLLAVDGREALAVVEKEQVDCLLLDIMLPDMDGFTVCERIKKNEAYRHIQVIGITGSESPAQKIRGIEAGFDDYLFKPVNFTELKARIKALLKKKFYLDQLQNKYHAVFQQAITDSLTGLYNNAYCKHFLDIDIRKAERQGYPIALIMADLDDFKKVNDTYGHISGDQVLQEISSQLANNLRVTDVAARYGGEEFAMILPYTDAENAMQLAERLLEAVRTHVITIQEGKSELSVTVSLGIATYPEHATTMNKLFEYADQALYASKAKGKNCCTLFTKTVEESG